jgi:hypothetical protein
MLSIEEERSMDGMALCPFGVRALGVSAFGVSAFGVSAFGVSALGVRAFGVSAFVAISAAAPLFIAAKAKPPNRKAVTVFVILIIGFIAYFT